MVTGGVETNLLLHQGPDKQPRFPSNESDLRLPMLRRWTIALVALGVLWRVLRYFLQFPIYGDEAFVCLNFINQNYLGLTKQLRHAQVAPLLFLWSELTAFHWLGPSDLALRLLPLLAGLGGLALFWRLARLTLNPLAETLAVGTLAVANCSVSMCNMVKPYSFDLLMSLALLVPAVQWLAQPQQLRWLALLALVAPVAMLSSYPAIFIATAVSVALVPEVCRQRRWKVGMLFVAYTLSLLAGFFVSHLLIGAEQLDRTNGMVKSYLQAYWADAFPPSAPLPLLRWLALTHTGRMMAYPVGQANGASLVTCLLCLAGMGYLWKARQRTLLFLCVAPLALGIIAAAMRRYPYGGCWRLSQHVAPLICLMAGAGMAAVIECARTASARQRWTYAAFHLLALVGIVGMFFNMLKPYRTEGDLWTSRVAKEVLAHARRHDQIIVLNPVNEVKPAFQWLLAQSGARLCWQASIDGWPLDTSTGQLWCLHFAAPAPRLGCPLSASQITSLLASNQSPGFDHVAHRLAQSRPGWVLAAHVPYTLVPAKSAGLIEKCDVYRWVCLGAAERPAELNDVSCWP
jgi:hypothetical protein